MAGLLDEGNFDTAAPADLPPGLLSLYAAAADPVVGDPGPDGYPLPGPGTFPTPTMATTAEPAKDEGPGFFSRLGSTIGDIGLVLAGGDPGLASGLTPEQRTSMGNRALLQFGLSMLANSGPTYTPRNFGQILAAGLQSAGQVPIATEQALAAQQTKQTELALRRAGIQLQGMGAQARLEQLRLLRAQIEGGQKAVENAIGGGGAAPGTGTATGSPSPLAPYVPHDLPAGVTPDEDIAVRTVYGEAGGESPEGQAAVAATIHNRATAGGQSVSDVVFTPNAYQPWNETKTRAKLEALSPTSPEYQRILSNIRPALTGQADPTGGATHFVSPAALQQLGLPTPSWAGGEPVKVIGGHRFFAPGYKPVQVAGPGAPTGSPPPASAPGQPPGAVPDRTAQPAAAPGETPPATQPAGAPAVAPDTPEIAAARQKAAETRQAQLRALRGQLTPNTADKVQAIEHEYQTTIATLDKEARDRQAEIDKERRASEEEQAKEARLAAQRRTDEEHKSKLQTDRELALEAERARNEANKTYKTAALNLDTDQLKKLGDRATAATNMIRDTRALQQVAVGMGGANPLLETDFGKQLRDWMVAFKIGDQEGLTNSQRWDRLIGGLFGDTHVQGLGNQTDREGQWLMRAWGGAGQSPIDRLTQLSIVRKLAEERLQDNADAQRLFRGPQQSLEGLPDAIKGRGSLFDRPPTDPTDTAAQRAYNARHAPGEPFYSWVELGQKGSGRWEQYWTRRTLDKARPLEYLTPDVSP